MEIHRKYFISVAPTFCLHKYMFKEKTKLNKFLSRLTLTVLRDSRVNTFFFKSTHRRVREQNCSNIASNTHVCVSQHRWRKNNAREKFTEKIKKAIAQKSKSQTSMILRSFHSLTSLITHITIYLYNHKCINYKIILIYIISPY